TFCEAVLERFYEGNVAADELRLLVQLEDLCGRLDAYTVAGARRLTRANGSPQERVRPWSRSPRKVSCRTARASHPTRASRAYDHTHPPQRPPAGGSAGPLA